MAKKKIEMVHAIVTGESDDAHYHKDCIREYMAEATLPTANRKFIIRAMLDGYNFVQCVDENLGYSDWTYDKIISEQEHMSPVNTILPNGIYVQLRHVPTATIASHTEWTYGEVVPNVTTPGLRAPYRIKEIPSAGRNREFEMWIYPDGSTMAWSNREPGKNWTLVSVVNKYIIQETLKQYATSQ